MLTIGVKLGVTVTNAVFKSGRTSQRPLTVKRHAALIIVGRAVRIMGFGVMGNAGKSHIVINEV